MKSLKERQRRLLLPKIGERGHEAELSRLKGELTLKLFSYLFFVLAFLRRLDVTKIPVQGQVVHNLYASGEKKWHAHKGSTKE